ncbi:multidrug resistance-associated protein 1-like isoform X1 [Haliotis asinina]|uniref:multidrug resistance-associated protein 1-like isoform X1 n=2 Tax=Haliotis asinina TaxID=109174 RepID=UPI0035323FBC
MANSFEDFCGGTFWNNTELLHNSWPELTSCFRFTVLIWVSVFFLWVSAAFYVPYILSQTTKTRLPISALNIVKTFSSGLLCILSLVNILHLVATQNDGNTVSQAEYLAFSLQGITYLLTIVIMQIDRVKGVYTSGILFVFWTLEVLAAVIPFYTYIIQKKYDTDLLTFVVFYVKFGLQLFEFILQWISDVPKVREGYDVIGNRPCPEVTASFPSRFVYWWITKLVIIGYKRGIVEEDLWDLNPRDQSQTLVPPFEKEWSEEVKKVKTKNNILRSKRKVIYTNGAVSIGHTHTERTPLISSAKSSPLVKGMVNSTDKKVDLDDSTRGLLKPSLMKVLWRLYGCSLLLLFGVKFVADLLQMAGPLVMSALINYISNKTPGEEWKGYVLATSLLLLSTFRSIFYQASINQAAILGMQMKTTLIAALYKKALTLSNEAKKTTTTGEIVNLMSVDSQRINDVMNYLYLLWSVPVQIILSIILLYVTIGPSVFAGLGVLLIMIPFNGFLSNIQRHLQTSNLKDKDERIKLLNEILNGIKVLKLYAWEESFKTKVEEIRKKEISSQLKIAYLSILTGLGWTVAPFLVVAATFAAYILSDPNNQLDANKAFVTLSLFNILRVPMNLLSAIMSYTVQAYVSVKRVNSFLCSEDLDSSNVTYDKDAEYAIQVEKGIFTWDRSQPPNLRGINLKVPEGKLVAIVGHVGSGKSSFLSAILGDMEKLSGTVTVKSSTAYVPQQAWIQNTTLRDNILFGKKFRETKYQTVIDACALKPDLAILAAGDETEIGERGINLSGGQKQRVSVARAVYNNADIYLFDDPLSAVDSHVGKHIFKNVIGPNGLLHGKTRILVTHGVHWLPMVDHIIVMNDGCITETGSYDELMSHDGHFAQFLKTYLIEQEEDDSEDPEIQMIREKMLERVESVTSDGTSAEEGSSRLRKRRTSKGLSGSGRRRSTIEKKETNAMKELQGRLTQSEAMETGKVRWNVFLMYGKAAGLPTITFSLFLFCAFQAVNTGAGFYLTNWTEDPQLGNSSSLPPEEYAALNKKYLGTYWSFALAMVAIMAVCGYLFWTRLVRAAARLHEAILSRVFRSPMSFFDTTPLGRIINRMSRDVETIDNTLPVIVRMFMSTVTNVLGTIVIISINTPLFIAVMIPLLILYYFIQNFYIPTSCQLKRIESVTRSPVYIHFSETITGSSSIRAYGAVDRFIEESKKRVDKNQVFYFGGIVSNRWLSYYLDMIGTTIIFASAIFAVLSPDASGGQLGLSVSYALQVSGAMGWMVKQISDLQTNIVSVERVKEYSELQTEADAVLPDSRPPADWPQNGTVHLNNYRTRYRDGLDLVLKGITCTVNGGQKVGIVGRTGAGKSSFTLALFRILEAAGGSIVIDGINIAEIGLYDVRSRLTILPQDPVLFSGTMRMNLDPFNEFSDTEIWRALDRAHLKRFVVDVPGQLMYECGEGGENLSVGQRQLVCLARALLRHTKVLVLDEATAAVDMETDSLIQKTIREAFTDCTIITIAHRLNTVMDYDRIIVMDSGKIKEYDTPETLLSNSNSTFYGLAKNAGLI